MSGCKVVKSKHPKVEVFSPNSGGTQSSELSFKKYKEDSNTEFSVAVLNLNNQASLTVPHKKNDTAGFTPNHFSDAVS